MSQDKLYTQLWLIPLVVLLLLGLFMKSPLTEDTSGIFEKAQKILNMSPENKIL